MVCDGDCPRYENDGVCNVPNPCPVGTDCADCRTAYPSLQLASTVLSFVLMLLVLLLILSRLRRVRNIEYSEELKAIRQLE